MKLKQDFIVHTVEGETLLVPLKSTSFSGLVRGNKTFGAVLEALQQDTSEDAVVDKLAQRFDAPREVIARDVHKALDTLREIDALDQ